MARRGIDTLNVLLLIGSGLWNVFTWHTLPVRIPVHFDITGTPDRWIEKGFELVVLYLVPFFTTALLYGTAMLIRRYPALLNMPRKEEFLKLSFDRQSPVFDVITKFFSVLSTAIIILFFSITRSMQQVALGKATGLQWHFLAAVLCDSLIVIIFVMRFNTAVKQALRTPDLAAE